MTHVTCRLTAKNRDQIRNPTLGNRVCTCVFVLDTLLSIAETDEPIRDVVWGLDSCGPRNDWPGFSTERGTLLGGHIWAFTDMFDAVDILSVSRKRATGSH